MPTVACGVTEEEAGAAKMMGAKPAMATATAEDHILKEGGEGIECNAGERNAANTVAG